MRAARSFALLVGAGGALGWSGLAGGQAALAPRARVDFGRDVLPVLADRCFPCHGPDANANPSGLRLDERASATTGREGRAAIVPGDPAASELVRRVRAHPDERMPPPESKLVLDAGEIELLERWIAEGAEYAPHWAFRALARPEPPAVADEAWPRDELDRFVLAELERAGLAPAAEATRAEWLRRASFDLTGLPPTPGEVRAFEAQETADAYAREVQRLLASPRYGEHMAAGWLDLARYADTYGYQNDVYREVWPWRDWVIEAFNRNMPYDEFVTWQLAGDLLADGVGAPGAPGAAREQGLATAFNRLHRQTNEGGSVDEEFRVEYVSDRVHTFGMAFLGLTLECARCHDHKFDPIAQREYYALSGYFASIDESGLYSHFTSATPTPALDLPTPEQEAKLARLDARVRELEAEIAGIETSSAAFVERFLEDPPPFDEMADEMADEQDRFPLDGDALPRLANLRAPGAVDAKAEGPVQRVPGRFGGALELTGDDPLLFPKTGHFARSDPFTLSLWVWLPERYERAVILHRSRAWTDAGSQGYQWLVEEGRWSAALIHFWPGDALCVQTTDELPRERWVHLCATYDGSSRAAGLALHVDGVRARAEVVRDALTRGIQGGDPGGLTLGERFRDRGLRGGRVDELRVFGRELGSLEVAQLFDGRALADALARPAGEPALRDYYFSAVDEAHRGARRRLAKARAERDELHDRVRQIMTMRELPAPRPVHLLQRGRYDARVEEVARGVPAVVHAAVGGPAPRDRLELARWLFQPGQPLTARVAVNRLWQQLFARALVETSENFGRQGTPPSHPALLDHLACEYAASGWDTKALLARIVLSATYRQGSRASERAREADPDGRRLSRYAPRRLSAEMLRDAALFASGLLVERVGGPSVRPYQPPGLWEEKSGLAYVQDTGEGLWRRSLYTIWKRTSPPPAMMLFDAAKRDVCVARRQATSTPLQALVIWNDPQLVEAARVLGERLAREFGGSPRAGLEEAFRALCTRAPAPEELAVLEGLLDAERASFDAEPGAARELVEVGERAPDAELPPVEVAAWTVVVQGILSHDAALVRR